MKAVVEDVQFLQEGTMCFGDLHIEDGFVERIDYKTPKPYCDLAVPGFVDLHTHGFRGYSCACGDVDQLRQLAIAYAKRGIVGFAPTLEPMSLSEYDHLMEAYREAFQGEYLGARFYGIHMEGPYLNPLQSEEFSAASLQEIHLEQLERFLQKNEDLIKIMSISPELPNGFEAIKMLQRYDVQASLAQTMASYELAKKAFEEGINQVTHVCNAMPGLNHHESGAMDAIIRSSCMCEMNMDGIHIQKEMLPWLVTLIGAKRIMAISDGSNYSGYSYPEGYHLDEHHIVKRNAIYRNGHLSSSFSDLWDAFRYLYRELRLPLEDCVAMTSINAGKLLNTLNYEIGLGKKADLVIMDHNLHIKDVVIQGRHAL